MHPWGYVVFFYFLHYCLFLSSPTFLSVSHSFFAPCHPSLPSSLLPPCPLPSSLLRCAEPPTKYQISKPTLCSLLPGELLKLSCPLPQGSITWTKDGTSLGANNRTLIEQAVLQIRDATPRDSGLYVCSNGLAGALGSESLQLCFIVNITGESGQARPRAG